MESLFAKMEEFVKMESEISATEFQEYYKSVMAKLTADFENLTEDELFRGKIITSIMSANAGARAKRKNADAKKFKKINEKSSFWADAIDYRLKKSGLSEDEIGERTEAIEKEMH
ncbi:MAG: hypothetical protein FWF83_05720 [Clostridiales bacterium]|nr:hypothetical protein [Clostridiales bacterium]